MNPIVIGGIVIVAWGDGGDEAARRIAALFLGV